MSQNRGNRSLLFLFGMAAAAAAGGVAAYLKHERIKSVIRDVSDRIERERSSDDLETDGVSVEIELGEQEGAEDGASVEIEISPNGAEPCGDECFADDADFAQEEGE